MQDLKPHYLLFTLFIFSVFSANHACNQLDRNSLLSLLLDSSNSTPFNRSSNNCCHWEGISCDHKGRVTHLWLPSKGLKGSISPSLGNLTSLSHLNLSHNSLTGLLPTGLFSLLNQLRVLDLSYNHLGGQLPSGIGGCSKLKIFWAGFNSFSRFLPHDIYNATSLEEISLPSNNLSGPISNEIMNLTKLTRLEFQNHLSGNLPVNIGKLSKLKQLILHKNNLTGSFSHSLQNCTNLIHLNLRMNSFDENITDLNISSLHRLNILDLSGNNLIGKFPASIHSCVSIRGIRIALNQLEGQIPPEVAQLKYLSFFSVGNNKLTNITAAIKILMHCNGLEVAILGNNFLKESKPTNVSMIDTDGFKNLRVLDLSSCQLTGQFPIWISKLKNLQLLRLASNRITGSIPSWLSTLPRLNTIDLQDNLFSGKFPKKFCALQTFVSAQAVDDNRSSVMPFLLQNQSIGNVNSFFNYFSRIINLRNNSLSGTIPTEIGCLKRLRGLYLSHNKLTGTIPTQISELTDLEYLYLSANHLYGEIPVSLISLHFLHLFSVANNNLSGAIPVGTQLQTFDASTFEGNPGLCGYPLPPCSHLTSSKRDEDIQDEEDRHTIPWFHVTVVLGFIIGFWGVCGPLVLNKKWRVAYFRFFDKLKDRFYEKLEVFWSN